MKKAHIILFLLLIPLVAFAQWSKIETPSSNHLRRIAFVGNDSLFVVGHNGEIMSSFDAGNSWTIQNSGTQSDLFGICMFRDGTGYSVGSYGVIIKTTDFGENWQPCALYSSTSLRNLYFINKDIGFVCGYNGLIAKTTDGGETWSKLNTSLYTLRSIIFTDENIGFCVGDQGHIYKTTNQGADWFLSHKETTSGLWDITFTSNKTGYACGLEGVILKTTDAGETWTKLNSNTTDRIHSILFLNSETGYCVGDQGGIYQTTDSGSTWQFKKTELADMLLSVNGLSADNIYITSKYGIILKSCSKIKDVDFDYSVEGNKVEFKSSTLGISSFFWDFGDYYYYSAQENPTHEYSKEGTFKVSLVVSNNCNTDTITKTIITKPSNIEQTHPNDITISPNPSTGTFYINGDINLESIEMYNIVGKQIKTSNYSINNQKSEVSVNTSPGVYLLNATTINGLKITKKLIIE